jgi:WD40 repeat protein
MVSVTRRKPFFLTMRGSFSLFQQLSFSAPMDQKSRTKHIIWTPICRRVARDRFKSNLSPILPTLSFRKAETNCLYLPVFLFLPTCKHPLIDTDVARYGLSQILNSESMLDTPSPIPFQFLINGVFLRTSLEEYLTANGLSAETTLNLQYVRSLIPPLYEASFEHDDWVSCVDVLSSASTGTVVGQERILSGSYDGLLRVWNKSGQTMATSAPASAGGHTQGIKTAKFLSSTRIVSAGMDRTIRVWDYTEAQDHFSAQLKPKLELYGHRGFIHSVSIPPSWFKHLHSEISRTDPERRLTSTTLRIRFYLPLRMTRLVSGQQIHLLLQHQKTYS